MAEPASPSDLFNELAYEFAERLRQGERPSLSEYIERHPELADEIRDLFPTLVMMEQVCSEDGPRPGPAPDPLAPGPAIPDRLGDYRIIREIGRGGMGVVYEAEQESLGRHVALKILIDNRRMDPVHFLRFQREARAAALLHHTNIVPVFAVGVCEGVHYYAMQYIQGRSLDVVLRQVIHLRSRGMPPDRDLRAEIDSLLASLTEGLLADQLGRSGGNLGAAPGDTVKEAMPGVQSTATWVLGEGERTVAGGSPAPSSSSLSLLRRREKPYFRGIARLGIQAAEALAHAHAHGLVHRDIKPANLLLDRNGTIWVTDFGLARTEGAEELTSPGDVVGTLRYMAPERFRGESGPSSDIYSLGASLYELLTLRPAFPGSHRLQVVGAIVQGQPVRPRKLDPLIPRDLETIVLKAMSREPSHRFASAAELARELGRFVDGRPIRSRRASPPERLWRWSRRNPAVASLTLLAAVLATALAFGSTIAALTFREQLRANRAEQRNTWVRLAESHLERLRAERYSRQLGSRRDRLETLAEAAGLARAGMADPDLLTSLRGEAIASLAEAELQPLKTWPGLNYSLEFTSFAFNADRFTRLEGGRRLALYRISDRALLRRMEGRGTETLSYPTLDATGRFAYVLAGQSAVELYDLERCEVPRSWPSDTCEAAFSPEGSHVVALRPDGEVRICELPSMAETSRIRLETRFPNRVEHSRLALSRGGRVLAVIRGETQDAWVYELASGRMVCRLKIPPISRTGGPTLNSKGTLLAVANDRVISVYGVKDEERVAMLQGHQGGGIRAHFDPQGDMLYSECWDGIIRIWDPIRGRLLATLPGRIRGQMGPRSRIVVGQRDDLTLYQIDQGEARRTVDCRYLRERAEFAFWGPEGLDISPDGTMIAMALRPDGVRIVRLSDSTPLSELPIGRCNAVLYLPDGSLLTYNALGLCHWPVSLSRPGVLQIGPPQPLAPNYLFVAPFGAACSAGGGLVGIGANRRNGSLLLDMKRPWRRTWLRPHDKVYDVAISPDGRWAATAGEEGGPGNERVKIWDTATGHLEAELPGLSCVAFSPDGQWLGLDDKDCYRFFRTGSWTPVSRVGYEADRAPARGLMRLAFHPSGTLAAVLGGDTSSVRLVAVNSGRLLAAIEGPNESQVNRLCFSPDGRFLAVGLNSQKVDLWDLATIRRRLRQHDLGAGFPDVFGDGPSASESLAIKRVEVVGASPAALRLMPARWTLRQAVLSVHRLLDDGLTDPDELQVRADQWNFLGQWQFAVQDYRSSLGHRPDSFTAANELAWCLTCEPGRGDPEEAVHWARHAVNLAPGDPNNRNTLGAALYRAGRIPEAVVEFESNIASKSYAVGYDWVFLSMCRARRGELRSARLALAQAESWRAPESLMTPIQVAQRAALIREAHSVLLNSLPEFPAGLFAD
jgi:serine/threonine protein kinase/WD40 repeat protein